NPTSATSAKGVLCSCSFKNKQWTGIIFSEDRSKNLHLYPLPIFILSVLSCLPKARLSKNKIFIVFRFSIVTDKTTQNKKDTRENSRIFYSAIAPLNGTNRFKSLSSKKNQLSTISQTSYINE